MFSAGFPDNSAGKEYACNAGDHSSISGLGRSPGEGIGYPFHHSWASLVAQMVKNPPAMQVTWVGSLGWEDSLEKGMATTSSVLAWRIPMDGGDNQTERLNNLDRTTKHSIAQLLWQPEPLHICQQEWHQGDFPGDSVGKTPHSWHRGPRFQPWSRS